MKRYTFIFLILIVASCQRKNYFEISIPKNKNTITGSAFYYQTLNYQWQKRDSLAVAEILNGSVPNFFKKFIPIKTYYIDTLGKSHSAIFFASVDYLSIGNNKDWARVPLTPMAAQKIADSFHCFMPTKKMVDLIYRQAKVKLQPMPMYIYRDSSITMWQHHLIIEGQRKNRKGLIAGIKKDVILSAKILEPTNPNKVVIYGWHQLNGIPIQPVYAKHGNWYVDYSHGIRLIYETIIVDGKKMFYADVLKNEILKNLICDEEVSFLRYSY